MLRSEGSAFLYDQKNTSALFLIIISLKNDRNCLRSKIIPKTDFY